jgi:hypothetical protein
LVVPENQPRLDWTMILACTDLLVFARDERGMLPEHGQVTVRSLERDPIASNALTRPVRTTDTRFPFLASGDYRVVIDRGGERSESKLKVARRDIRLRLRP